MQLNKNYIVMILFIIALVNGERPPRGRPPHAGPPRTHPISPPPVSPPVTDVHTCPEETGEYSTCCPSHTHSPDDHPPQCDHFPIDSRYIAGNCEYHEATTGISCATREHFMQIAMNFTFQESGSLCPSYPFAAVIVNHTAGPNIEDAEIITVGKNKMLDWSSVIWHGEMVAIHQAGPILNEKFGRDVSLDPEIFQQLSIYTTGEPCPMCAMAIRWAKFGEVIQASTIPELNHAGLTQPNIRVWDVHQRSNWCQFPGLGSTTSYQTRIVTDVLRAEILPYFLANNPAYPCPEGCHRPDPQGYCEDI